LLLSLPYALVVDRTLHTRTMHRRYPALAHLPFDAKRKGADDRHGIRRSAAALLALLWKLDPPQSIRELSPFGPHAP
jgi:hypothetical protein